MSITVSRNGEGFGSLYQCMMSGIAYCRYYNKKFIYTPVKRVDHNVSSKVFDNFTGLLALKLNKDEKRDRNMEVHEYLREVHFAVKPSVYYTKEVRDELRKMYHSTPKNEKCPFDIAIHIRRGDVIQRRQSGRFINNKDYKIIIDRLRESYPGYTIGIYSEGEPRDFKDLRESNIKLILNGDPLDTYHHLVTAKVLVTAKSSFSFSAAILSEGYVWYIPMKHKPLDEWKVLEDILSPPSGEFIV
jgi:hypothetical protein